jgi:hypothetical protein
MTQQSRSRKPVWLQRRNQWHLVADGETVARIIQHREGFLSRIDREPCNGWSSVDFSNLAHAKACLAHWWSKRETFAAYYHYCTPSASRFDN